MPTWVLHTMRTCCAFVVSSKTVVSWWVLLSSLIIIGRGSHRIFHHIAFLITVITGFALEMGIALAERAVADKYLVSIRAEYDAAKEGAKDSAETARKIQDLEASVKDTQELSKRYKHVLDHCPLQQGLRLPFLPTVICDIIVRDHRPLQQGLRLG